MKKLLIILFVLLPFSNLFSQVYAYSNKCITLEFNEYSNEWVEQSVNLNYYRFVITGENYILIENNEKISKYNVLSSEDIEGITLFTVKSSDNNIYKFYMTKTHVSFIIEGDTIIELRFNIYLWEK
jgi:hypothetical protein